jgi:serine protease Do
MSLRVRSKAGRRAVAAAGALSVFALAASIFGPSAAQEASQAGPEFAVGWQTRSFADVIEEVKPAVVNIMVTKVVRPMPTNGLDMRRAPADPRQGTPFDDFFERFFGPGYPGAPNGMPERRSQGQGSGFVIDPAGYIATNNHVVQDADEVIVRFDSGHELTAQVVGQDPQTDLALIKVETDEPLPSVAFADSDLARVGDWVLAIGNPFGLGGTSTAGIISARGRDIASGPYDDYFQIDAPINSGNSGGPVFNAAGDVIGINTAIFSPNGGNVGIGFAIPSNQAELVLGQLKEDGDVSRGWLGVQIQTVDEDFAAALDLDDAKGALIGDVVADSPAERAGIEVGDVVIAVDDTPIETARDLGRAIGFRDAGANVNLTVLRDGRERSLNVRLGEQERPVTASARGRSESGRAADAADFGLTLGELTPARRAELDVEEDVTGAVVLDVRPGSPAASRGLRPGDVIVSVDRRRTDSVDEVIGELKARQDAGEQALVLVRRGDSQHFVTLKAA